MVPAWVEVHHKQEVSTFENDDLVLLSRPGRWRLVSGFLQVAPKVAVARHMFVALVLPYKK